LARTPGIRVVMHAPEVPTVLRLGLLTQDWLAWEGYHESRRCSRDTHPESYITNYTSIRRLLRLCSPASARRLVLCCARVNLLKCQTRDRLHSSSSLLRSSLELSDTEVCEPEMRALLGTAAYLCKVVELPNPRQVALDDADTASVNKARMPPINLRTTPLQKCAAIPRRARM